MTPRLAALAVLCLALAGCGLPTIFTGVAETPAGRTNAGAGLAVWKHAGWSCPDGDIQGALAVTNLTATCEIAQDGTRKETFSVGGADPAAILASVLAAQSQQNAATAAALNQLLASVLASPVVGTAIKAAPLAAPVPHKPFP